MNRFPIILLTLCSLALFYAAGTRHEPLLDARRTYQLNQTEPVENAPPMVAFTTVALGGFRGIIADALWLRASRLQQEGRYFELVQLSDWITKLEPRFSAVWAFHGWNMAYNVSVMFPDPEDRWRWVRHGISLLRDEGLYYNRGDAQLYRELGWFFQHKIGATADNAHLFYKKAWNDEMERILPGGVYDHSMSDVPGVLNAFASTPETKQLVEASRAALGFAVPRSGKQLSQLFQWLETHPDESAIRYKAFARRKALEDLYNMKLDRMEAMEESLGQMDWRLPQTHAAYWALQGLPYASGFDRIANQRMVFQSMADAFLNGDQVFMKNLEDSYRMVNFQYLQPAQKSFREALEQFPEQGSIRTSYKNFLTRAVFECWLIAEDEAAENAYQELRSRYEEEGVPEMNDLLCATLEGVHSQRGDSANLNQIAEGMARYWSSRGDLLRAARVRSIPAMCLSSSFRYGP